MSSQIKSEGNTGRAIPSGKINIVLRTSESASSAVEPDLQASSVKSSVASAGTAELFKSFDRLVGLDHVKALLFEVYALLQVGQFRTEAGLHATSQVYHMVFKGNPGTGKTTVARLVAKLFQQMGVLTKGHLVEVERADLVGEYIGHTAVKTRDLIKRALGGILFIDEAYSLARGGEKDFGKEAIDTLVKAMEDYKNQFVLILAGYPEEMDFFMQSNPGLPSRFPVHLDFPDYSVEQLMQIADTLVQEREYSFHPQATFRLRQHLMQEKLGGEDVFSNARFVRNVVEKSIRQQAVRLLNHHLGNPSKQELILIRPEDLNWDKKK